MEHEKHVDESWKDSVLHEKESTQDPATESAKQHDTSPSGAADTAQEADVPEVNFLSYIASLVYQAVIFLGEVPSPIDNKTEVNLIQAKLIIDTLRLLKEKTNGNLTKQEEDMLSTCLYELQVKYIAVSQTTTKQ